MSRSVSGITKKNKQSIQEIKQRRHEEERSHTVHNNSDGPVHNRPPGRGTERAATFGMWFVGVISILFLFFLFSVLFAETTVTVYPKTASISIDDSYTASRSDDVEGVGYSVVSAEETVEMTATSTGSEYREQTASGEITIFNDHSSESIRLVPNTRFEAPNGLIYRTRQAVTVPGQTASGPGTVDATVYASEPGSDYNTGPTEFSIPGFVGTTYEGDVYAESSGSINGGIAREVPVVSSSTQQVLEEQAAEELRDQLTASVRSDLPEGFVMYDDGTFFSTSLQQATDTSATSTALQVTGQLQAVTFDERQLSTHIATNYSDDVSESADIRIRNLADFEFAIENKEEFDITSDNSFQFSLSGESLIVWQYDERALVRDLRGLQKDRLNEVLVNYDGIQEAEVVTRPFWKRTLPETAEEITIVKRVGN